MAPGPAPGSGRDEDPVRNRPGPGDPLPDQDPARPARRPGDPRPDEAAQWRRSPAGVDWMDDAQWEACLAARLSEDEPPDPDLCLDPDRPPLPGEVDLDAIGAECREITADEARAAALAARLGTTGALAAAAARAAGRRGPGLPGSAQSFPGEYPGPAAGFASGMPLDAAPGCSVLAQFADDAADSDGAYSSVSDDELLGLVCAWDRVQAHASARKHGMVAELIRRRPAPGCVLEGPARMPAGWEEFTPDELAAALAQSRWAAGGMLDLSWDLEVKLPGTRGAFLSGILQENKAKIIADATQLLDPEEARAAEALVLDRAGRLTPGGLRSAIARAVIQVAPDKARKRREEAAKDARVERWTEDSGNAALVGRELPPAEVLAADQRVTWWAKQLRQAGLDGSMDELRARSYLDLLLGMDSRPAQPAGDGGPGPARRRRAGGRADDQGGAGPERDSTDSGTAGPDAGDDSAASDSPDDLGPDCGGPDGDGPDGDGAGDEGPDDGGSGGGGPGPGGPWGPVPAGPLAGAVPPGFAGRLNLTVPLATMLGLADRPGEAAGIGPVDPALARDLARAAARNPRTTWCLTVTDQHGHAIGHGCARSAPNQAKQPGSTARAGPGQPKRPEPGARAGPDPPSSPQFAATVDDGPGGPGGYGTWRLSTGIPGQRDLIVIIEPVTTDPCDHRREAAGHDPGVMLRHLAEVRYATCTGPACRRPAAQADFEHNVPYQAGGRSCLCNGHPKCRRDHRVKQHPRWHVEQLASGNVQWTTPAGRQYATEPTRYPI
jgi:hypothetical protein